MTPTHDKATPRPQHKSDCAVHNAPALPKGPCDCGAELDALKAENERLKAALELIAWKPMGKADTATQKFLDYSTEIARKALNSKADAPTIETDYKAHLEIHCSRDEAGIVDAFEDCECEEWAFARHALGGGAH